MAEEATDEDVDVEGEDEDEEEGSSEGKKKVSGKTLVLIGVPLLLVLVGGGLAFFFGLFDSLVGSETEVAVEEEAVLAAEEVVFYDLPEMLVNIKTSGKASHFLKVKVALELDRADTVARLEALLPRIVDNFQVYLRELRTEDLTGSAGMFRVKEELLTRINAAIEPLHVNDVLFKEILIQ